jgi:hypothetical protein
MFSFESDDLPALARDFGRINHRLVPVVTDLYADAAEDLVKDWRDRAVLSSGVHGKHYPNSIDAERVISTDIAFEVGPNPHKRQGRMHFESGSSKQPPHPDGQNAADRMIPLIEKRIDSMLDHLGL